MSTAEKKLMPSMIDWPLGIGLSLTAAYYAVILQPACHGTLLHRYTTEHTVEYAVVLFFLWGLADTVFHLFQFPGELMALRHEWFARRVGREPASRATFWLARLRELPARTLRSRIGQRYVNALSFVEQQGSAEGFSDHLHHLADADYEKTQGNYALLRFICWVMPMFGFLGTVVHFGSALSGQTSTSISENLPHVVAAMGTAFCTTTAALACATAMMFSVFLCERIERGIVLAIDARVERDMLHRFEQTDASMAPYLDALAASNQTTLEALDVAVRRHLDVSTHAMSEALERLEQRFDAHDARREDHFARLVQAFEDRSRAQLTAFQPAAQQISGFHDDLARFVDAISTVAGQHGELTELQNSLATNLRLLRETRQIDQAVHGLTAAIHLLTARGGESRAA